MTVDAMLVAEKLQAGRLLTLRELQALVEGRTPQLQAQLAQAARDACEAAYGNALFARGLIEFTSYCKNDCLYCGLRRSNRACQRYRLSAEEVLACAEAGYRAGFRTFVLQGGEDPQAGDEWLCALVRSLKEAFPDCAVTLSVGERPAVSYRRLRAAGADRYLLRHETATAAHYRQLHPSSMTLEGRMACLRQLRAAGFAVGVGFMVGSPGQTAVHLAADLAFVQEFRPEMCGVGPFVPHHATPFAACEAGSVGLTCYLLSIIRLMNPMVLLPATTALEALDPQGRQRAVAAGANVVMPNLSPAAVQGSYQLYDGKPAGGLSAERLWEELAVRAQQWGKHLVVDRGDYGCATAAVSSAATPDAPDAPGRNPVPVPPGAGSATVPATAASYSQSQEPKEA